MDGRGWQGGAGFFGGVDGWGRCLWFSICWYVCSCFDTVSVLLWGGRNRIGIPETGEIGVTSTRSSIWFTCLSSAKIHVPASGSTLSRFIAISLSHKGLFRASLPAMLNVFPSARIRRLVLDNAGRLLIHDVNMSSYLNPTWSLPTQPL